MSRKQPCRKVNDGRRGVQTLELMFALPVLAILLMAALGYTKLLTVRAGLTHAATVAAREAGKGGSLDEIVDAVNRVLAADCIAIGDRRGCGTKVVLQDGDEEAREFGDPGIKHVPTLKIASDEVRVTVCVRLSAVKPASLSSACFGLSLGTKPICVGATVKKEDLSKKCRGFINISALAWQDRMDRD